MKSHIVQIETGQIVGTWNGDRSVCAFKGVPYARAPIGPFRWQPPQPPERWRGVRPAQAFGPRCIQPNRPANAIGYFGAEPESEDCLYLNIWAAGLDAGDKRPVMMWLHGGAFAVGSGSLPIFDATALARRGVVAVTINYRLGRLGFLAHPDLSAEQPQRSSGNYGLLDQIAALRWIKANIAAFGGDPDCVTVFGQSAGSSSMSTLMGSPLATGLYHRAIGQSGGAFFARILQTLDKAETSGAGFARAIGAPTLEELRARPAREIQLIRPDEGALKEVYDAADPTGIDRQNGWTIIDGFAVPEFLSDTFAARRHNDVPLLTGSTADEGTTQPAIPRLAEFVRRAHADYGGLANQFLRIFPAANDAEAELASRRAVGTRVFNWENWTWANWQTKAGRAPVYFYHFAQQPPKPPSTLGGDLSRHLGAFHTADIPYVFETLGTRDWPWSDDDRALSGMMARYWVNFAGTGDPNGAGLPDWPRYDRERPSTAIFKNGMKIDPVPDMATLQFWNEVDAHIRKDRTV